MNELIVNDPDWGDHKYLLNSRLDVETQEKTINDILKYYPRADWRINELW